MELKNMKVSKTERKETKTEKGTTITYKYVLVPHKASAFPVTVTLSSEDQELEWQRGDTVNVDVENMQTRL